MFLSKYDFFRSCTGQKQNFKTNDTNILQNGEFIQKWRNSSITKFRQSQKLSLNLKNPELKNCPKNILGILNLISNEGVERFNSKFPKEITFCQFYGFIKSQPQVVYNKVIPQSSCSCEICEKAVCISKSLSRNKYILPNNLHSLVEQFSCNSTSRSCVYDHTRTVCEALLLNSKDLYCQQVNQQVYQWQKLTTQCKKRPSTHT